MKKQIIFVGLLLISGFLFSLFLCSLLPQKTEKIIIQFGIVQERPEPMKMTILSGSLPTE